MVQTRTRIMNQLQAVALNEGLRCKKRLWRESGREQLEAFRLARWASRRRHDLLELLDRLTPTIAELTQAIEQEVEKCPAAQRLRTHPGVGPLTALAFVLIILALAQASAQPAVTLFSSFIYAFGCFSVMSAPQR
jgi:transposase